jgi:hypothetical protein
MAKKPAPDWEAIEREYRAGQLSIREIARNHGTTDGAIRKRAKKDGWERDLSQQVREKVRAELVRGEVRTPNAHANQREAIDTAAARGVEVIRSHRKDISDGRSLVQLLLGQLKTAAENREEIEEEILEETAGDDSPKRRGFMLQAISLPKHATALKDLSTALKNLIPLERQAFNLDEPGQGDPGGHLTPEQARAMAREVLADGDES